MRVLNITDGSVFYLDKFDDDSKQIEVESVIITEGMHGELTQIEIKFKFDQQVVMPNDLVTGYLTSSGGYKNQFEGYVYECQYNNNSQYIKILCCKPKFLVDKVTTKYTSIDNGVESTYQLPRLDSVKSDILSLPDGYAFYQKNESNYSFCTRLCRGYKYNTVFGYLMDGLKIVDLNSWKEQVEFEDKVDIFLPNNISWTEPKLYNESVEYIDYSGGKDPNHVLVKYYDKLIPTDTAYKEFVGNTLHNTRLSVSKSIFQVRLNSIFDYQVGDYVKILSDQINFNQFFISKRVIELQYSSPKVTYTIQSINP